MEKMKFALRILAAILAVLAISSTAMAYEKSEIFVQTGRSGGFLNLLVSFFLQTVYILLPKAV